MSQYGYGLSTTTSDDDTRKVAIYARVSSDKEEQLSALENQKDWYTPLLQQHKEWKLIQMYVDEGITGTSAKKRPQFLKMIEDAQKGKFDLILTREVSRFARNTVDTLQYTRELKSLGIEVFFINDNIRTFDGDGELRLTIMATLAQDESRKTSIRVKAGQHTAMEKGVFFGNGNILGYDKIGQTMVINPEQAETVKRIFDLYLDGLGTRGIAFQLEKEGRLTGRGRKKWTSTTVGKILSNSFYCGIITYHKQYTPDYLEQKAKVNYGEVEKLFVKGTHQPIITEEQFKKVQEIFNSRRQPAVDNATKSRGKKTSHDVWNQLMICECGCRFNRKIWRRSAQGTQYCYQCNNVIHNGAYKTRVERGLPTEGICKTHSISTWKLQMMAKFIFSNFIFNTTEISSLALSMLDKHIDDVENDNNNSDTIIQKENEINKLTKRLDSLIEMRADGEITKDVFLAKQQDIESTISKLREDVVALQAKENSKEEAISHEEKIKVLKYYLEQSVTPNPDEDLPEDIIRAFIKKIVVHEYSFDWYLRFDETEGLPLVLNVDGKRQKGSTVSTLCTPQHLYKCTKGGNKLYMYRGNYCDSFVNIANMVMDLSTAKQYCGKRSTSHKYRDWHDITISIFV